LADTDPKREDSAAVDASQAFRSSDADAFGEGGDSFNLFSTGKECSRCMVPELKGRPPRAILSFAVIASGPNPGVDDPGPGCFQQHGPTDSWFPGQGSDLDPLARKAGVLPIRPTGIKPIRGRVFQLRARTRPFLF
jgi:hypothetical protein